MEEKAMSKLMAGADNMFLIIVIACIIVLLAMIIDLISGLNKAKQRGEIRSSYGLSRSLSKFIMYEGGMLIAAGVDILMHFSKLLLILHLNILDGVPVITCLLGIFLLIVEGLSVKEKADDKTKTEISRVEQLAAKMINKDELVSAFTDALLEARKKEKENGKN
jgi:uncharacterized membrane protein